MIKDPKLLVDNCFATEAIARRLETRLTKQRGIEAYNQEMKAFVERCTSAELSKEEMELWARRGQPVVKEESAMSKVQVVDNRSLTVVWRYTVWDPAKAYNTIKTFDEEMHMRRLVWRWREVALGWTVLQIDINATHNCCSPTCGLGEEEDSIASPGAGDVGNLLNPWWGLWRQQGFAGGLPYNKLTDDRRTKNLKGDDVCLFQYENKVKSMLCCVQEVKEMEDGLCRTVTIVYKVRRRVSFPLVLVTMDVAIQRLVLLVPGEKVTGEAEEVMEYEAWNEG